MAAYPYEVGVLYHEAIDFGPPPESRLYRLDPCPTCKRDGGHWTLVRHERRVDGEWVPAGPGMVGA